MVPPWFPHRGPLRWRATRTGSRPPGTCSRRTATSTACASWDAGPRWGDGEEVEQRRKTKVANMTLYNIMYMWLYVICRVLWCFMEIWRLYQFKHDHFKDDKWYLGLAWSGIEDEFTPHKKMETRCWWFVLIWRGFVTVRATNLLLDSAARWAHLPSSMFLKEYTLLTNDLIRHNWHTVNPIVSEW